MMKQNKTLRLLCSCLFMWIMVAVCFSAESIDIDFSDPTYAKLDENAKDIIREYAKAYPDIERFYKNIRLDATVRIFRLTADEELKKYIPLDTPPILESEERYEVRYNTQAGGYSRVDSQFIFHRAQSKSRGSQTLNYEKRITLLTPEMGYVLSKYNPEKQFYSLEIRRGRERYESTVGIAALHFDTAPFAIGPYQMEYVLFGRCPFIVADAFYTIDSVRYIDDSDEQLVEFIVRVDWPDNISRPPRWVISMTKENWLVKEIIEQGKTVGGKEYWNRYSYIYDQESNNIPILSKYQFEHGICDPDKCKSKGLLQRVEYEITNLVPGPVALSEFDVAQFLPPNTKIGEITYTPFSIYRIAAIAFGIVLVILGIAMKIRFVIIEARKQQQKK